MPYAAIDLFCGVGGLTKGLGQAGINVVAGIDFEPSCQYAYEENNNSVFIQKDITDVTPSELQALYPANADIRILAGCAPCQPFSKYTQRYRKDGYKDEKWRLLYSFGKLAKEVRPAIVAMENVPELEKTHVFKDFIDKLEDCGYHIFHKTVYCPDYGVPQSRKRLVLLASLLGDISLIPPTHTPETYVTVRDAIGDLPPLIAGSADPNDLLHSATALSDKNLKRIRQSVPGGTWRDWDKELQLVCHKKSTGKTYPSVYGRMLWDAPSPTITTQFYGYGNGRFGHPEQDRALSLREGAILQSFPRDYKFLRSTDILNKHKLGVQIGNAVPVRLGEVIGISIIEHIRRYTDGKEKNNQRFFRIMKSNFLLMLYNLVEATFTTGMLEIYEQLERENCSYGAVIDEIQNIWRDYKIKEIYKPESGLTTYTNRVRNIVLDITQNTPLALTKGMLGVNGNLNAKQIKDICDRHRIRYQVTDDRQVLEKVKKKRNSLAHGDESFSHCARDLTLTDLETIKDTVIQFIQEILTGMEKYCDEKQFLRHA